MARKNLTISDDLLNNALEMTQRVMSRREVAPGYTEYYTPCGSNHSGHVVTITEERAVCDCAAWKTCKHILASVGRPALHAIAQLRWATSLEDIDAIVDFYAPAIRPLPQSLKNLVRLEIHHQQERIYRSGEQSAQAA